MDRPTVLILGGYDKHTGFEEVFNAPSEDGLGLPLRRDRGDDLTPGKL